MKGEGNKMKRQSVFPGILFIGVGLFFLLHQFNIPYVDQLVRWPSILVILGFAFLLQSYMNKDYGSLFPGTLLLLLGIHFHMLFFLSTWPSHWSMYTCIVGLSFLHVYAKTKKDGLLPGIILLVISALGFFSGGVVTWFQSITDMLERFWPLFLIALGIYLLFKRK